VPSRCAYAVDKPGDFYPCHHRVYDEVAGPFSGAKARTLFGKMMMMMMIMVVVVVVVVVMVVCADDDNEDEDDDDVIDDDHDHDDDDDDDGAGQVLLVPSQPGFNSHRCEEPPLYGWDRRVCFDPETSFVLHEHVLQTATAIVPEVRPRIILPCLSLSLSSSLPSSLFSFPPSLCVCLSVSEYRCLRRRRLSCTNKCCKPPPPSCRR
jgi:hypothetical protein